jgi:hypothetical protein
MKQTAFTLLVLVALLAIGASLADVRCTALRPSSASLVLVCSASRLEARR